MSWLQHYQQADLNVWQGRADSPENACFFQRIQLLDLKKINPPTNENNFALLGFCCDEGIRRNLGRIGAAAGPEAIRKCLAKLPCSDDFNLFDAGNIFCLENDLESAQQALGEAVSLLLKNKMIPIILGGGHEVAWGNYQGIEKEFPQSQLGIINFDAHFDMRQLLPQDKGSSGTPFLQIAQAMKQTNKQFHYNCIGIQHSGNTKELFKTAQQFDTHILYAEDFYQKNDQNIQQFIRRVIQENEILYLSLCLDVFSYPYATGVSAPQVFGLTPWQVLLLLREISASGKVVSYDIAELSPQYDLDQRTAKLAAHFIYEIIRYHPRGYNLV